MSYYKKFRIVIGTPLWRQYLRWAYGQCLEDFKKLNFEPNFSKKDFTCLLCGVGNEVTADEFIRFVLKRNISPNIWIIDLGSEQVKAVKQLVKNNYPNLNIKVKELNALDLGSVIRDGSVDWIETDGLFEFFENSSLRKLLIVWKKILSPNGFITTRATSTDNMIDVFLDIVKIWIGKAWLNVELYTHTRSEMHQHFIETGLSFVEGSAIVPFFKRYAAIK